MNPLDRLVTLADRVPAGLGAVADPIGPGVARIGGRSVAMLGANDYLGLSFDPEVVAAARGVGSAGTTGSRVANGTTSAHRALESAFAVAFGRSHAVAFTTGYQANLGVISGLVGPGDAVVLDAEAHASLFDGARLSGADLFVVRHNDPADLDRRLARLDGRPTVVAVEGLYSIGGDTAPLPDFAAVCRGRAALLVDEAHAFGAYGLRGLGVAEELGVAPDVITGTFSKALGGVGGFAVSDHPGLAGLRVAARSYVFTAAGTPSSIAAAHAALAIATDPVRGSALRDALWARVARLRAGLAPRDLGPEASPIVRIRIGDPAKAVVAWNLAIERGVYVNLVLPPACRRGAEGLRVSVSAAHDLEQLDRSAAILVGAVEDACA